MKDYLTIVEAHETEEEIMKSRFIARVYPIETAEEAQLKLHEIRKEHYKARHVCSAYVLNTIPIQQKADDDGEPSGTAGKPILEVIMRMNLKNILVVVIRYFGGIKLGAGGLIRAYSNGASTVIHQSEILKKQYSHQIKIGIDYKQYDSLKNLLRNENIIVESEAFNEKVDINLNVAIDETDQVIKKIQALTNDQFKWTIEGQRYIDVATKEN